MDAYPPHDSSIPSALPLLDAAGQLHHAVELRPLRNGVLVKITHKPAAPKAELTADYSLLLAQIGEAFAPPGDDDDDDDLDALVRRTNAAVPPPPPPPPVAPARSVHAPCGEYYFATAIEALLFVADAFDCEAFTRAGIREADAEITALRTQLNAQIF